MSSDNAKGSAGELSDEEALAFLMAEAAGDSPSPVQPSLESTPVSTPPPVDEASDATAPADMSDDEARALLEAMEGGGSTPDPTPVAAPTADIDDDEARRLLAEMEGDSTAAPTAPVAPTPQASAPKAPAAANQPAKASHGHQAGEEVGEINEWEPNEFQADPTMMEDFLNNTGELMEALDRTVLQLESDPTSKETIEEIFRAAHTLKGASGMFGFRALERVMHRMENLFDQVRKGNLVPDSTHIDLVFKGLDVIRHLLEAIRNGAPCGVATAPIVNALSQAALGGKVVAPSPAATSTPPAAPAPGPAHAAPPASSPPKKPAGATASESGGGGKGDDGKGKQGSANKEASTIRVDLNRLDALVNLVGELVIDRTRFNAVEEDLRLNHPHLKASGLLQETTQLFARHMNEIQTIIMTVRMVPIGNAFNKYPRIVRDLARSLGKEIDLVISGESAELDKTLVEQIADPLVHLIRNACDHGVETPEVRKAAGKSPKGRVLLSAEQEGNQIVITIEDDGKGMNPTIIRNKAIEKGIISESAVLKESEIFSLIFAPGFSTAEKVTEVSGRGVGMDVVKRQISKLKGSIHIDSVVGRGSKIRIELPLTLAIVKSLLVKVLGEMFAIPSGGIVESLRIGPTDIQKVGDSDIIRLRKKVLPLMYLSETLNLQSKKGSLVDLVETAQRAKNTRSTTLQRRRQDRQFVVVVGSGDRRFGIVVDQLLNQQEMVIKSMGPLMKSIRCIAGGAVLGHGEVVAVLDLAELEEQFREKARRGEAAA